MSVLDLSFFPHLYPHSPAVSYNNDSISRRYIPTQRQRCILKSSVSQSSSNPRRSDLRNRLYQLQEVIQLCESKKLVQAFSLLQERLKDSIFTSSDRVAAVTAVLQACGHHADIETGRKVHTLVKTLEDFDNDSVVNSHLISMYSKCGSPLEARFVLHHLQSKNLIHWNSVISGYTRNECWEEALDLFVELLSVTELKPDIFTLPCVVKACAGLLDVKLGQGVHGLAVKMGLDSNAFVGNALIALYGRCEIVECAANVFVKMTERNLVSWNSMLFAFSEIGFSQQTYATFLELLVTEDDKLVPDVATLVTVLPVCAYEGDIEIGVMLHSLSIKLGLIRELRVNNALIDMYCKCGYPSSADVLFCKLDTKNEVTWNSMLKGCSTDGDLSKTFGLLRKMQMAEKEVKVDDITLLNVLPVFSDDSEILSLKELHGFAIKRGFLSNEMAANALVGSYARCKSLRNAESVFNGIHTKKASSWNALINGFAENGESKKALNSFCKMIISGLSPDHFTVSSALVACTRIRSLNRGKELHGYLIRKGLESDPFITSSLLSLYIHCNQFRCARILLVQMEVKDLVHWNTMLSACAHNGYPYETLTLFRDMLSNGVKPHVIAILSALGACSQLSSLLLGQELHCYSIKTFLLHDTYVISSIINMYAKSGSIERSLRVFNRSDKQVAAYNAIISACGIHWYGQQAIELFNEMQRLGKKPDGITLIAVLTACNHSGMIDEGLQQFKQMQILHGLEPQIEHYACVVDMLGRNGRFDDALKLIDEMPYDPDIGIWNSLLSSCRIHGNLDYGERFYTKLMELDPNNAEGCILLSNLYSKLGNWDGVRNLRQIMKESDVRKEAAHSWIEVGGKVHSFVVGDQLLPENRKIEAMWRNVEEKIGEIGYKPDLDSVLHDVGADEKMEILRGHSEKVAISFGLMNSDRGRSLRVWKNIRICVDCHSAAKAISKVFGREIIVRDNKRFHHFRDGSCSCGDYW